MKFPRPKCERFGIRWTKWPIRRRAPPVFNSHRCGSPLFVLGFDSGADTVFLCAQLRSEFSAEVLGLEYLANFDFRFTILERIRTALHPFDRFLFRFQLQQPEAGDQLFGLGERPVDDGALAA